MKREELFEAIGGIDDDLIEEAKILRKRTFPWKHMLMTAACLVLVMTAAVLLIPRLAANDAVQEDEVGNHYNMYDSKSQQGGFVTITELAREEIPTDITSQAENCFANIAPRELFAMPTDIFVGEVVRLRYFRVDVNGAAYYYSAADIRVGEVYRGDVSAGDVVTVKTVSSFAPNVWTSTSGTVCEMEKGVTGIFMLNDFTGESVGGAFFDGVGIITHYFMDGERFAFLETADGLVFAEWAYPAIKHAKSMKEIEAYVKLMTWRLFE